MRVTAFLGLLAIAGCIADSTGEPRSQLTMGEMCEREGMGFCYRLIHCVATPDDTTERLEEAREQCLDEWLAGCCEDSWTCTLPATRSEELVTQCETGLYVVECDALLDLRVPEACLIFDRVDE